MIRPLRVLIDAALESAEPHARALRAEGWDVRVDVTAAEDGAVVSLVIRLPPVPIPVEAQVPG